MCLVVCVLDSSSITDHKSTLLYLSHVWKSVSFTGSTRVLKGTGIVSPRVLKGTVRGVVNWTCSCSVKTNSLHLRVNEKGSFTMVIESLLNLENNTILS